MEGTPVVVQGMEGIVTALTGENGINATNMFAVVKELTPLIVTMVPIALGLYFLRRLVNGAGKAKVQF